MIGKKRKLGCGSGERLTDSQAISSSAVATKQLIFLSAIRPLSAATLSCQDTPAGRWRTHRGQHRGQALLSPPQRPLLTGVLQTQRPKWRAGSLRPLRPDGVNQVVLQRHQQVASALQCLGHGFPLVWSRPPGGSRPPRWQEGDWWAEEEKTESSVWSE